MKFLAQPATKASISVSVRVKQGKPLHLAVEVNIIPTIQHTSLTLIHVFWTAAIV